LLLRCGLQVYTVGLGSDDNARRFSEVLNYPLANLYADPTGDCYKALGFSPGFLPETDVNPYLKLLPMLMGIGSPGTVQEVSMCICQDTNKVAARSLELPGTLKQ
jgi:hypothetical protein